MNTDKMIIVECIGMTNEEVHRVKEYLERIQSQLPCEFLIVPKEVKVFTREDWEELINALELDNPSKRRGI